MPPQPPTTPHRAAMTRSFTVPTKLTPQRSTLEIGATKDVETLYLHPNTTIIKFSTPSPTSRPSTPRSPASSAGSLPWTSPTERTLASGPLQIYRVPGSVSFLHSGSLLHAILPRSQCWCVDGVSKFTMRVLPDTYYRIELPAEDLEKVEELKQVLAKVLFYERTACPFYRGVEEECSKPTAEELHERRRSRRVSAQGLPSSVAAKKWRLSGRYSWLPEDGALRALTSVRRESDEEREEGSEEASSEAEDQEAEAGAEVSEQAEQIQDSVENGLLQTPTRRPNELAPAMRSVTAPILPTEPTYHTPSSSVSRIRDLIHLNTPPTTTIPLDRVRTPTQQLDPTRLRGLTQLDGPPPAESRQRMRVDMPRSQIDPTRLRTFQSVPTDMPPSPPDSSAGLEVGEGHVRQLSVDTELEMGNEEGADDDEHEHEDIVSSEGESEMSAHGTDEENEESEEEEEQEDDDEMPAVERRVAGDVPLVSPDAASEMGPGAAEKSVVEQEPSRSPIIKRPEDHTEDAVPPPRPSSPLQRTTPEEPHTSEPATTRTPATPAEESDPFAAIQARILARRSIGSTPIPPTTKTKASRTASPLPTSASSSKSSSSSLASKSSTSSASTTQRPRLDRSRTSSMASALVAKASAVFLGPPAQLVAIMLRIAKRLREDTFSFGAGFVFQSPAGSRKVVPGSFDLDDLDDLEGWGDVGEDVGVGLGSPGDDHDVGSEDEEDEGLVEEEDDFGVPLRSPVRLANMSFGGVRGDAHLRSAMTSPPDDDGRPPILRLPTEIMEAVALQLADPRLQEMELMDPSLRQLRLTCRQINEYTFDYFVRCRGSSHAWPCKTFLLADENSMQALADVARHLRLGKTIRHITLVAQLHDGVRRMGGRYVHDIPREEVLDAYELLAVRQKAYFDSLAWRDSLLAALEGLRDVRGSEGVSFHVESYVPGLKAKGENLQARYCMQSVTERLLGDGQVLRPTTPEVFPERMWEMVFEVLVRAGCPVKRVGVGWMECSVDIGRLDGDMEYTTESLDAVFGETEDFTATIEPWHEEPELEPRYYGRGFWRMLGSAKKLEGLRLDTGRTAIRPYGRVSEHFLDFVGDLYLPCLRVLSIPCSETMTGQLACLLLRHKGSLDTVAIWNRGCDKSAKAWTELGGFVAREMPDVRLSIEHDQCP
ncbi:hypothetical protein LTR56_022375 [Elasticomyces elasticus]|nr:hypothetical protein LTR56_022375 [Elasticomyces elasticus]KAK3627583.1 hypothetical protein LTR22_022679 [Elasticomyces elasticus]KAK4907750.1 hypothetical protein LTR49_023281 [Elasticomyces elasticus]KAK5742150.1 hypothetical protein LTS12_024329 [Elasticomyces elasticus]